MKLSDVAPVDGIGYREVLEREALAAKARSVAREAATKRTEELERALAASGHFDPGVAVGAARVLEVIEGEPSRYLDPKVLRQPDVRAEAVKVRQTPGMITNNRYMIRQHLLAVVTLAKLLGPLDDEMAGIVDDAANGADLLKDEEPK